MSTVSWATLDPNVTETLLSIMRCRENPHAVRVRTSQGDGGIDVIYIDSDGWHVDQIKYFPTKLDDSRKQQIRDSFKRLRNFAQGKSAVIAEWNLWVPLDPNNDEREWFQKITKDAGYPCEWRGLSHCEGLVAKYPEVVDYYLQDGADRLAETMRQLIGLLGIENQASKPADLLKPADVESNLSKLHAALNSRDPHYRYDFSVDASNPATPGAEPFLVAAVIRQQAEGSWVTFKIFARMVESLKEREIPIKINVQAASGGEAEKLLEDFNVYGMPFSITASEEVAVSGSIDLPGGLGASFSSGTLYVGPVEGGKSYDLRMQILDDNDALIDSVVFGMEPVAFGLSREGAFAHGVEQGGALGIEIRTDLASRKVTVTLRIKDLSGLRPIEVLAGLRVADSFHSPNKMRFAERYGPAKHASVEIPGGALFDLKQVIVLIEALIAIQDYTDEQIVVPDFSHMHRKEAIQILNAATLLRAGSYGITWTSFTEELRAGTIDPAADLSVASPLVIVKPLVVRVGELDIPLGFARTTFNAARIESAQPKEGGGLIVVFAPGDDNSGVVEFLESLPEDGQD
ncbi:hypothetical protein Acy02nite_24280 [Actinoplanes cyaneus]|uniref:Restriction endonuclease type IV Mrr domain-containing protein n=1 Tax=Actinoplanes cyaneus TaxID=52696 RepID=A0A919IHN3_9ACTN|nr:hypothetical protein [Actinoplanes cyaneus]MCW2136308.1 hypothetical protein [Actinoplanes cyaneus]GID64547.1 hypothetical protein Acy02nite_24280 [Actinoplanes cyaneus]